MYQQPDPYRGQPSWAPPRRWWQHPALIITLLVLIPPAGMALAWLSRWSGRTKIVVTVVSGLWFLAVLVSDDPKEKGADDPKPATTATASAAPTTAEPTTPPATTEAPTPTPEPTTQAPTTEAPEPTTQAPTTEAPEPAHTTPKPVKPRPAQTTRPAETAEPEPEVHYANCTEVRDAGAAPIHRGDPGYSSRLDRDGDGVACER
ncbi:excalibur calcium-binding domain-containing protein [Streptomyces sp. NPDC055055]